MAIKDVVKVSRKTFVNPRGWLGYDLLKGQTQELWDLVKGIFIPATPSRKETFEQALARLKVSEADLVQRKERYFLFVILFLTLGVLSAGYGFYVLFMHGLFASWLLSIAVTVLFLAQAFRFHFWLFQIKHRKLGCTLEEWWQGKPND